MPTHAPYTPQPGSGAMRVLQWFRINREEMLTASDIASKFSIPKGSVPGILERTIGSGMLRISRDAGFSAYAAGPKLDLVEDPAPPQKTEADVKPAKKAGPGSWPDRRLPDIDPAAVEVRVGIPLPPMHLNRAGEGKYTALLDKLTAANMSFTLPKIYRASLVKCVAVYSKYHAGKRKFVVRSINRETCGVWRTE